MNVFYTIAGYKTHYSQDAKRTLCGREVSNSAGETLDMCKACVKAAAKITEHAARAAETQDDVMQSTPAGPIMADWEREITETGTVAPDPATIMTDENGMPTEAAYARSITLQDAMDTVFRPMVGQTRIDPVTGHRYVVKGVQFRSPRRFHGPSVVVSGEVIDDVRTPTMAGGERTTYGAYASESFRHVPNETPMALPFDYAAAGLHSAESEAIDRAACELPDDDDEFSSDAVHGITFEWSEETMCGRVVKAIRGVKTADRVTVDPTDVTCSQCADEEAQLAALDAQEGPTDDETHAAFLAALTAAEERAGVIRGDVDPLTVAMGKAHGYVPANLRPGGMVHIPGLPETACVPMLPTLTLTQTPVGRILASVGGQSREFTDNRALRMHVSFWAHSVGFGPAKGRAFKWHQSGKIIAAPATRI